MIASGREPHHLAVAERFALAPRAPKDPTPVEAMAHRLMTPAGKALYARRKQLPEPVFGIIKSVLGFRQFLLRGLDKVRGEWSLATMAWNLKQMFALSRLRRIEGRIVPICRSATQQFEPGFADPARSLYDGRRVLVRRDPLLTWRQDSLSMSPQDDDSHRPEVVVDTAVPVKRLSVATECDGETSITLPSVCDGRGIGTFADREQGSVIRRRAAGRA